MGRLLQAALARSEAAEHSGALVPLHTERVELAGCEPFVLRRLLSDTPKHLRSAGPKPNPFLPWDPELEVERLSAEHVHDPEQVPRAAGPCAVDQPELAAPGGMAAAQRLASPGRR